MSNQFEEATEHQRFAAESERNARLAHQKQIEQSRIARERKESEGSVDSQEKERIKIAARAATEKVKADIKRIIDEENHENI